MWAKKNGAALATPQATSSQTKDLTVPEDTCYVVLPACRRQTRQWQL